MVCKFCKEEIREGAVKCKECGENLGKRLQVKQLSGFIGGFLSVTVSLGSLGLAYMEYQGRVEAVQEKEVVELDRQAAQEILQQIPTADLSAAVREEVRPVEDQTFVAMLKDPREQETLEKIEDLIAEGNRALQAGREEEAEQLLLQAADLERSTVGILKLPEPLVQNSLGYIYIEQQNIKQAINEFEKALERDPKNEVARKGLLYAELLLKGE
ncbi:MAG: tetratricopeptide repeat protein [archaeon]|jgi:tetratricopeptide (TPR) repeat protein|nr:tetratricopeptide repeat protein [archaeon]